MQAGQLSHITTTPVGAGYGPRHMAYVDDIAIVACELQSHVLVFDINADGSLTQKQDLGFATNEGEFLGVQILFASLIW